MIGIWDYCFDWLPLGLKSLILGFITFTFIIAIVKFIKR